MTEPKHYDVDQTTCNYCKHREYYVPDKSYACRLQCKLHNFECEESGKCDDWENRG